MWLPEVITSMPAARSDWAVDAVRPIPPATFSPLAVTKSMPRSSRRAGTSCSAAGLDGERALDALEAVGDRLEVLEPLDVGVHRLAAGAGSRRADRVGDLDDRCLEAGVLDLLMMRGDAIHHLRREVVPLGDLAADRGVRTF